MNKVLYVAIAFALVVPGMMFASSDSFSFGASNAGSSQQGGSMGAGKVSMQDMHMMRECMSGTGNDMNDRECADGKHIKEANLTKRTMGSGAVMGSGAMM